MAAFLLPVSVLLMCICGFLLSFGQTPLVKKIVCSAAVAFLFFSSAKAQKKAYSYEKALADSMAKYNVPTANTWTGNDDPTIEKAEVEAYVDLMAWRQHLEKNLQKPIEKAAKKGMKTGYYIVLVRFLVEKDGTMSDVKALNDPGYGLAEASVKVLKAGPLWVAGELNGKKVRSYHTQPLTFVISEQ